MTSGAGSGRWFGTVDELVSHIKDGDSIAVSGFHFVRVPMAQLRALVARSTRNLRYVSWGGGLPLELLLAAGAVSKITFCFSSLDVFGLAPRFRRALEAGELEVEEWTALALTKALEAAGEGMGYEVLQRPAGSDVFPGNEPPAIGPAAIGPAGSSGPPMVAVPAINVDVLMLHAQRADEAGNVEITGARGLDIGTIFAAKKIVVTVEERVPEGTLGERRSYILPRSFVTGLALAPGGARPTSCLPFYGTEYRALGEFARLDPSAPVTDWLSSAATRRSPAVVGDVARGQVDRTAVLAAYKAPEATEAPKPADLATPSYTVDELMVCLLAREVTDASVCSVGSVSPLATAAYFLAKRTTAPGASILSYNGGYLDVAFRPMCLIAAEALDYASCVVFAGGDETYHNFYQRGLVTHEIVQVAQVDRRGATNTNRITRGNGRFVRLPGQGGMADVANLHANFMLYITRHSPRSLVDKVETVSAWRTWHGAERLKYGLGPGSMGLITNLGRFRYEEEARGLVLTHAHPGVTVEEVAAQTGFPLRLAPEFSESTPPTSEELRVLRQEVDPFGVRRLEFSPSAEREALLEELLSREETVLRGLSSSPI